MALAITLQSATLMLLFGSLVIGGRLHLRDAGRGYLTLAFIWILNAMFFLSVALVRKITDGVINIGPSFLNLWSNTIYFHAALTLFLYVAVMWLEGIPRKT